LRVQDAIRARVSRASSGCSPGVRAARPRSARTASLEAYRASSEGSLKIESLDVTLNRAAIKRLRRAIVLDPKYAMAYAGLANAEFIAYEQHART
jgi:hypothetical protein